MMNGDSGESTRLEREARVERLRKGVQELIDADAHSKASSTQAWVGLAKEIRELVMQDDPDRFCTWRPIGPMFVKDARYLRRELWFLRRQKDWASRWREALEETTVGSPPRYPWYWKSSGNLIHHAYHLARFEQLTGIAVEGLDFVFEFGGGYGSMCRLFHRLGFRGKYLIFDLPMMGLLQRFFLESVGIPLLGQAPYSAPESGAVLVSDAKQLPAHLNLGRSRGKSLFMATWSLSETPVFFRAELEPLIESFDCYLMAYQERFEEIDNREYFDKLKARLSQRVDWKQEDIAHVARNTYLMGAARSHASAGE